MGEIADDCYDRALDEMEDRDADPCWDGMHAPLYLQRAPMRKPYKPAAPLPVQAELPFIPVVPQQWKFLQIERKWPFSTRDYMVQENTLEEAINAFYSSEHHQPFSSTLDVPHMFDVQENPGGWIVYGETNTTLIYKR